MKATLVYQGGSGVVANVPDYEVFPLLRYDGSFFVLRSYVLSLTDEKSREAGGLLYHEVVPYILEDMSSSSSASSSSSSAKR